MVLEKEHIGLQVLSNQGLFIILILFSLPPPIEFVEYVRKLGLEYQFNYGNPIQNIDSVRCEYFCLYFLDNIWRKSFYDLLKVFDLKDTQKNEIFIKKYFS